MSDPVPEVTNQKQHDLAGLNELGFLTDAQVAAILRRTRRSLWEDRRRHRGIPHIKYGNLIVYRVSEVQRFLVSLETKPKRAR
jgi:hypothetical protein